MSRREFLKGALSLVATLSVPESEALAQFLKNEPALALQIKELQRDLLKPDGILRKLSHPMQCTAEEFTALLKRIKPITKELERMHYLPSPSDDEESRKYIHAKSAHSIWKGFSLGSTHDKKGKEKPRLTYSNSFLLHANGVTYEVATAHGVEGTLAKNQYYVNYEKYDLALRRLTPEELAIARKNETEILNFDSRLTKASLAGKIGVISGRDSYDSKDLSKTQEHAIYSPLIPVSDALGTLLGHYEMPEPLRTHARNCMIMLLPDREGLRDDQGLMIAQGKSGSMVLAYDESTGGFIPCGNFIAVSKLPQEFGGYVLGYVSGPENLRYIVEEEQALANKRATAARRK